MNERFAAWRKSTYSAPDGHCIAVAQSTDGTIGVRDTKLHNSPILEFRPTEWAQLLERIRHDS